MEDNMKEIYDLINIDLKPLVFVGVFLILIIILLCILKAIKDHKRNKLINEIAIKLDEINEKIDRLIK